MQSKRHGDLRRRHVRIDLDFGLSGNLVRAARIEQELRLHQGARAADARAMHHTGTFAIKLADCRLVDRLAGRGKRELREHIRSAFDPLVHPVARIEIAHDRPPVRPPLPAIVPRRLTDRRLAGHHRLMKSIRAATERRDDARAGDCNIQHERTSWSDRVSGLALCATCQCASRRNNMKTASPADPSAAAMSP